MCTALIEMRLKFKLTSEYTLEGRLFVRLERIRPQICHNPCLLYGAVVNQDRAHRLAIPGSIKISVYLFPSAAPESSTYIGSAVEYNW